MDVLEVLKGLKLIRFGGMLDYIKGGGFALRASPPEKTRMEKKRERRIGIIRK